MRIIDFFLGLPPVWLLGQIVRGQLQHFMDHATMRNDIIIYSFILRHLRWQKEFDSKKQIDAPY